jgi:oligopeptide/dipeptide ABC transporter ATP-binding protein
LLEDVGIHPASERAGAYPFELSGGQMQRVMIACALAGAPSLLIADEPTTALDVTVQAQILSLLRELQKKTGMAILLITHDFGVVAETCNRVAVMYAGRIVEAGAVADVFYNARHPYTRDLIRSIPKPGGGKPSSIPGAPPDLRSPIFGCAYAQRCGFAQMVCSTDAPQMRAPDPRGKVAAISGRLMSFGANTAHLFACHFDNCFDNGLDNSPDTNGEGRHE